MKNKNRYSSEETVQVIVHGVHAKGVQEGVTTFHSGGLIRGCQPLKFFEVLDTILWLKVHLKAGN